MTADAAPSWPAELTPGVPKAISPMVRRIVAPNPGMMTGPGTNTYLVGIDEVAVIDPGPDDDAHLEAIVGCGGDRIRWILCTHTHPDHWPLVPRLAERTGARTLAFTERDGLEVDEEIGDGYVVEGSEFRLAALHTPGHASNHLCYLLEADRMLFSGDHIMNGSTVVIGPPDGDMATYLQQLERLRSMRLRSIAPGHGLVIEDPLAKIDEYLTHRAEREQQVLAELRSRADGATVEELEAACYPDIKDDLHPVAQKTVWAHLRKLVDDGLVTTTDRDDIAATWTAQ